MCSKRTSLAVSPNQTLVKKNCVRRAALSWRPVIRVPERWGEFLQQLQPFALFASQLVIADSRKQRQRCWFTSAFSFLCLFVSMFVCLFVSMFVFLFVCFARGNLQSGASCASGKKMSKSFFFIPKRFRKLQKKNDGSTFSKKMIFHFYWFRTFFFRRLLVL